MLNWTIRLLTAGILAAPYWGNCQTVINAGGQAAIVGAYEHSYSIGEPITETHVVSTYALTQGFLQPEMAGTIVGTITSGTLSLEVSIFPNPTSDMLYLKTDLPLAEPFKIQCWSTDGRLVLTDQMDTGWSNHAIPVSTLSSGAYQLCLLSMGQAQATCFTVMIQK